MGATVHQVDGDLHVESTFNAPPVVQAFLESTSFVTGFFGPFGCAKTTSGCLKSWGYGARYPGARIAVIRDTWPSLRDTTMQTFFEWFPDGVMGRYEAQRKTFWLNPLRPGDPPTEIKFRAMYDADDLKDALSLDLAAVHFDEPQGGISYRGEQGVVHEPGINKHLFEGILARTGRQRGYPKMAWLTGNPPPPSHWIARFFGYDPGRSGHDAPRNLDPTRTLYLGDQDTNRMNLPPHYYEDLTTLFGHGTPMERRFIQGLWIDFAQTKPFHREWIQVAGVGDAPELADTKGLVVEAGYDIAISKKDTASKTAIVVGARDMRRDSPTYGIGFILGCKAGHWSVSEAMDELVRLCRTFGVRMLRVEKVGVQEIIYEPINRAFREAGLSVGIQFVPPPPRTDKLLRANMWSPEVQEGRIVFGPGCGELIEAMCSVPDDQTAWDLVDAAGILVLGFRKPPGLSERLVENPLAPPSPAFTYATQGVGRSGSLFTGPGFGRSLRASTLRPAPGSTRRGAGYAVRGPQSGGR